MAKNDPIYYREYYLKNRDKIRATRRLYYLRNHERLKAYQRDYMRKYRGGLKRAKESIPDVGDDLQHVAVDTTGTAGNQ